MDELNEYLSGQSFWKVETGDVVSAVYKYMLGVGIPPDEAIELIGRVVNAMANEYGD